MSRDICADFARSLRHPSPEGIPADGPIEQLKEAGANVIDIRSQSHELLAAVAAPLLSEGGLVFGPADREDSSKAVVAGIKSDKLPLLEPLCWPLNGWWVVNNAVLLATFPLDQQPPGDQVEAFGVYPVMYATKRKAARWAGATETEVRQIEDAGVDLDSEYLMSPTGLMHTYLYRATDQIVIDLNKDELPPERERGAYQALTTYVCAAVVAANLMSADSGIVKATTRPAKLVAKQRRRSGFATERTTTINLPALKYERGRWTAKTGAGVAWHMVRGHWRELKSERYKRKRGQRVWVRPHTKGSADLGTVTHKYMLEGKSCA